MAELLRVDAVSPDPEVIARAAACLRRGGLVAFPTETVYGLGADATSQAAVARIFAAKGRPSTDPLIVHVPNLDAVRPLVTRLPAPAEALAAAFWPGPLTLVLPRSSIVIDEVTAGLDTVAVRVPAHPVARALVAAAGVPVAAPSANLFSRPSPTHARHVIDDLGPVIDIVLDGGPATLGVESTVVDLTSDSPVVLRPGGVSLEDLRAVLPDVVPGPARSDAVGPQRAPGLLDRHYSPRTPLTLFDGPRNQALARLEEELGTCLDRQTPVVALAANEDVETLQRRFRAAHASGMLQVVGLGPGGDAAAIASRLYVALRACDATGARRILALQITDTGGLAAAVRDRLRRASAGNIVVA